jgi:hypothetical protein
MKKAMEGFSLKDEISKRLREMSTAEMAAYFTILAPRWPFGTVVHHRDIDARAMILSDDGTLCKVITLRRGEVVETGRSVWEPMS